MTSVIDEQAGADEGRGATGGGGRFFLLGAGFSRAISAQMPLLPDLADLLLPSLGLPIHTLRPFGDNLESWLSFLSSPQPWSTDVEDLQNLAVFLDASRAMKDIIQSAEDRVVAGPIPLWLTRLVLEMANERSAVATFNYDLLFERALANTGAFRALSDIYAMSLEKRWPAGSNGFISSSGPDGTVPTLHKLHGSTNWYYGGLNSPTTARVTLDDESSTWGAAVTQETRPPRFEVLYDDLQPLMIPPTAQKTPFYGNISLRSQWRKTFLAMKRAKELVVIGFSFPASDQQVRLLARMSGPWDVITVVDPSEATFLAVQALYGEDQRCCHVRSVESYVDTFCGDLIEWGEDRSEAGYERPVARKNGTMLREMAALRDSGTPEEWRVAIERGRHREAAEDSVEGEGIAVQDFAQDRDPTNEYSRISRLFVSRDARPL